MEKTELKNKTNLPVPLIELLIKQAIESRKNAYAPYSGFSVGAAILTENEYIYGGCNIENASYSLSLCAERVALGHAIACGAKKFQAISIVYHETQKALPCGSCRQALHEFNPQILIVRCNLKKEYELQVLGELFSHPFELKQNQ